MSRKTSQNSNVSFFWTANSRKCTRVYLSNFFWINKCNQFVGNIIMLLHLNVSSFIEVLKLEWMKSFDLLKNCSVIKSFWIRLFIIYLFPYISIIKYPYTTGGCWAMYITFQNYDTYLLHVNMFSKMY